MYALKYLEVKLVFCVVNCSISQRKLADELLTYHVELCNYVSKILTLTK